MICSFSVLFKYLVSLIDYIYKYYTIAKINLQSQYQP